VAWGGPGTVTDMEDRMHRKRKHRVITGMAVLAVATGLVAPAALAEGGSTPDLRAIGLTADQQIVRFGVNSPRDARVVGQVRGLVGDTRLVGIDYRVQDRKLYGVGNLGGIYTLTSTGAATKVSQLTVALMGTNFGVDFNPAADRLRIISDTGQNLRHDVNPGGTTTPDIGLTYSPATTPATGVTAAAYSNNDLDATTGTTLFDIDTMLNQVAIQSPANSGQLAATGMLGVDFGSDAGFDIYSRVENGKTADLLSYAVARVGSEYRLYEISLLQGEANDEGRFPRGLPVTDIAIPLNQL